MSLNFKFYGFQNYNWKLRGQFNYYKIISLIRIYQNWGQINYYKILNILIWTYFGRPKYVQEYIIKPLFNKKCLKVFSWYGYIKTSGKPFI